MKKECLECQSPVRGRTDKKFCCLDCKSSYHNRKIRLESKWIRSTNKRLMKNRRILRMFLEMGVTSISKNALEAKEFSFLHITSQGLRKGRSTLHVYEYGYQEVSESEYEIFKTNDGTISLNRTITPAINRSSAKLLEINGNL